MWHPEFILHLAFEPATEVVGCSANSATATTSLSLSILDVGVFSLSILGVVSF